MWLNMLKLLVLMLYICHVMGCLWASIAFEESSKWAHKSDADAPPPHTCVTQRAYPFDCVESVRFINRPLRFASKYFDGADDDSDGRLVMERWITREFRGNDSAWVSSACE